jgi:hypothetical protein
VPGPGVKCSCGQAAKTGADHDRIEVSSHQPPSTLKIVKLPRRNDAALRWINATNPRVPRMLKP